MPLPLPDFLRPRPPQRPPAGGDDGQAVQAARTRARQRLVGALVLLGVGVIAFPLLFETQPRPLAADTPIKLSQRDSGTVQGLPPAGRAAADALPALPADLGAEAPASASTSAAAVSPVAPEALPVSPVAAAAPPPAASAPRPVARLEPKAASGSASASAAEPRALAKSEAKAEPRAEPKAEAKTEPKAPPKAAAEAPVAASASAAAGRFVVQVGAFSDARTLREARQKVEGLGLKTYTQVIDSSAGTRTRVRVGPFETRDDAESAARKIKGGGLPAAILAL